MPDFHPSALAAVRELRERFPDTPFLTLGQTVLWDEPVKASFCRILEAAAPGARMVAAVHDTDYFAKLPSETPLETDLPFVLLPHNDGDTRALWSAAGEISSLFGSETVPTRALLTSYGVAFDRVAKRYPGGERELLNRETEAPGWRAIVHTGQAPLIAADVRLSEVAPALKQQLQWAFDQSLAMVPDVAPIACEDGCADCARQSSEVAQKVLDWVDEFIADNPQSTLSALYQWLTPKLWCLARGGGTCYLETGSSMELFRFNSQTASRPRFAFLERFLNAQTREQARRCYDDAVRGSGIYTLDQFGPGALPFDVVIPGRGRGTLRLHDGSVYIETETPITLCLGCDCDSLDQLAALLESQFGPNVALVGKAVALISMLSAEYIFVFHEKASSYTSRTQKMNTAMREAGVRLDLHPMLRLQYDTWNALESVDVDLHLPSHLAASFGSPQISGADFAARWADVCREQDELLAALKAMHASRELLSLFASRDVAWQSQRDDYEAARGVLREVRGRTAVLQQEIEAIQEQSRAGKKRVADLERAKGDDFRARVQPLRTRLFDLKEAAATRLDARDENGQPRKLSKDERAAQSTLMAQEDAEIAELRGRIDEMTTERAHFDQQIADELQRARETRAAASQKTAERVELERSERTKAARNSVAQIEYEAELERLRRTRDAWIVSSGLRYINLRPTAWWFPLVSPDATWFRQLAATAQARLEVL